MTELELAKLELAKRSNEFIASFQIDAVCDALRFALSAQLEPGPIARQLVQRLRDDFVSRMTGRAIEAIPEVTDKLSAIDLLATAEVLRATMIAFLTPEEREERGPFGLQPRRGEKVT